MEYENVDRIRRAESKTGAEATLSEWFHDYLVDMRDAGIDPTSETHPSAMTWGCVGWTLAFCVAMAIFISLVVLGIQTLFE